MIERIKEKLAIELAWRLPRRLVYWCAIRIGAAATTGQWGKEETPTLTFANAIDRWRRSNG